MSLLISAQNKLRENKDGDRSNQLWVIGSSFF